MKRKRFDISLNGAAQVRRVLAIPGILALELSKPACRMLGVYNPEHNGLHFSLPLDTPLSPAFELVVAPEEITDAVIWASSSRLSPPPFEVLPASGGATLWSKKGHLHYKAEASNA